MCDVGQNFLWFNQGCSIGCAVCDGNASNPNHRDRCGSGMKSTNNDPRFWGLNRGVVPMSEEDVYQWNPWRSPGNAPVYGPCGAAGGGPRRVPTGSPYIDTPIARQGDLGTTLPQHPTGIVWRSGGRAEVKLSVRANHGGGYQWRLCAASRPLTEACFQQTPLNFTRRTWLEFRNGSRVAYVSFCDFLPALSPLCTPPDSNVPLRIHVASRRALWPPLQPPSQTHAHGSK